MRRRLLFGLSFAALLMVGVYFFTLPRARSEPSVTTETADAPRSGGTDASRMDAADSISVEDSAADARRGAEVTPLVVRIGEGGFEPASLVIAVGESVLFVNAGSRNAWPASNPHPAHSAYPERGGCRSSSFDACRSLAPGESWRFIFAEKGSWSYHNHLAPAQGGSIVVR